MENINRVLDPFRKASAGARFGLDSRITGLPRPGPVAIVRQHCADCDGLACACRLIFAYKFCEGKRQALVVHFHTRR